MNKNDFFIEAIKNKSYMHLDWILSVLTVSEPLDKSIPYMVLREGNTLNYKDITGKVNTISGKYDGPLFTVNDFLSVPKDMLGNIPKDIAKTTIGMVISNAVLVSYPFNNKLEYINRKHNVNEIGSMVVNKLTDNVKPGEEEDPKKIYVRELTTFNHGIRFLSDLSSALCTTYTRKNMVPPPGITKHLDKLIGDKGGELKTINDVVDVEKKLSELDEEFLKDDPSNGLWLNGKNKNIARKKLFHTFGTDVGFGDGSKINYVKNSLETGMSTDPDDLVVYYNSLRAGSYARGVETQVGGVTAKEIMRALSDLIIDGEDCGTKEYLVIIMSSDIIKKYMGRSILDNGILVKLNKNNLSKYIGKEVKLRTPMYCISPKFVTCKTCMGDKLSMNKRNISLIMSGISSSFVNGALKSMHGSVLKVKEIDIERVFT